jgi:hypothetical protein
LPERLKAAAGGRAHPSPCSFDLDKFRDDFEALSVNEPREPFALRLDTKAGSALLACADADVRDQRLHGAHYIASV